MPLQYVPLPNHEGKKQREARPMSTPILELAAALAFSMACVISRPEAAAQTNFTTKTAPWLLLEEQARYDINRQREGSEAVAIGLIGPTGLGEDPYYRYGDYYGRGDYYTVDTLGATRLRPRKNSANPFLTRHAKRHLNESKAAAGKRP